MRKNCKTTTLLLRLIIVDRRKFLLASLAAVVTACAKQQQTKRPLNIILGSGQFRTATGDTPHFVLSIVDLENEITETADIHFLAHGIHVDPSQSNRLAIFEKRGINACEFDLDKRKMSRVISCKPGRHFYGHGAYSADGGLLYSTETQLDTLQGMIAVRDGKDMSYVGEFPTFGIEPHECHLIDSGRTMVVTNGGGKSGEEQPSVTYIDIKTQALIERVTLSHEQLNTGHVAISKNGDLVVVSAPRKGLNPTMPGGVSIRPRGEIIQSRTEPVNVTQRMSGEALSVAIDADSQIAAVTHPDGNLLSFWSTEDARLLKTIELRSPRGVTKTTDNKHFIVSAGRPQPSLIRIPIATLIPDDSASIANTFITGSHIYNWSES